MSTTLVADEIRLVLHVANDNLLEIVGLRDGVTRQLAPAAVVAVTLVDAETGDPIAGAAWPLAVVPDPAVPGRYLVQLHEALGLADGQRVTAILTASDGDAQARWELTRPARVRRF